MGEFIDLHGEQIPENERDFDKQLRPLNFDDFKGQNNIVENLIVFVKAAKMRGEALDHVLLHGPPSWKDNIIKYYSK
jgi:Holliday junction DNA helicase RuvB